MGIFDFLKPRAPNSASVAKARLRIGERRSEGSSS